MSREQQKKIKRQNGGCPRYERNGNIVERNIENASFLVNPDTEEIFYLNSLSSAIWQLLAQPVRIAEVADLVINAFPDIPPDQIINDTAKLFAEFIQKNIVMRAAD